jgi:hypothetical protein
MSKAKSYLAGRVMVLTKADSIMEKDQLIRGSKKIIKLNDYSNLEYSRTLNQGRQAFISNCSRQNGET